MSINRNIVALLIALLLTGCAHTLPSTTRSTTANPWQLSNPKAPFAVAIQAEQTALRVGEPIRLSLQASTDGYLNLYFINAAGHPGQLLTNYPIRANETVMFPPATGKRLNYAPVAIPPKASAETFILVTTHRPLNLFSGRDIKNRDKPRTPIAEFTLTEAQLLKRLRGAMRQWPPQAWNAATLRIPLLPLGRS